MDADIAGLREVGISELSRPAEATSVISVSTVVTIADFHFHFPFAPYDLAIVDVH